MMNTLKVELVESVNVMHRECSGERIGKREVVRITEGETVRYETHSFWYNSNGKLLRITTYNGRQ